MSVITASSKAFHSCKSIQSTVLKHSGRRSFAAQLIESTPDVNISKLKTDHVLIKRR